MPRPVADPSPAVATSCGVDPVPGAGVASMRRGFRSEFDRAARLYVIAPRAGCRGGASMAAGRRTRRPYRSEFGGAGSLRHPALGPVPGVGGASTWRVTGPNSAARPAYMSSGLGPGAGGGASMAAGRRTRRPYRSEFDHAAHRYIIPRWAGCPGGVASTSAGRRTRRADTSSGARTGAPDGSHAAGGGHSPGEISAARGTNRRSPAPRNNRRWGAPSSVTKRS